MVLNLNYACHLTCTTCLRFRKIHQLMPNHNEQNIKTYSQVNLSDGAYPQYTPILSLYYPNNHNYLYYPNYN